MKKTIRYSVIIALLALLGVGQIADSPAVEAGLSLLVFLSLLVVLRFSTAPRPRRNLNQKNVKQRAKADHHP